MGQKKKFRELEKQLIAKNQDKRENEVVLESADFRDGKLSVSGFAKLKLECEYIEYDDDIEIKVPNEFVGGFKDTVEQMAAVELSHIRKDKREARIQAGIFLLVGVVVLAFGLVRFTDTIIRQEITIIVSWVFIWASAEKMFFDRSDLQNSRYNLLHILSGQVSGYNQVDDCEC